MNMHIPVPPKRIVALGGPVTTAIRAMRADEPATDYTRIRELRRAIADRIEADIALLDSLDPFGDEREADYVSYRKDGLTLCGFSSDVDVDAGEMPEGVEYGAHEDDEPDADDNDVTAPERAGGGFVRCGADDAEDGHDAEGLTDDYGIADQDGISEQFAGVGAYAFRGAY